ncbi:MAG: fibronectin type III domain-containing protein [Mycobacteriales bacterium]
MTRHRWTGGAAVLPVLLAAMLGAGALAAAPALAAGSWSGPTTVDQSVNPSLDAISCPSSTFCVAVDAAGDALTFNGTRWTAPAEIVAQQLTSVSCASATFCVAVDANGDALTFNGTTWSAPALVDGPGGTGAVGIESVSCPSATFCAATDNAGQALTFNGTSWTAPILIDPGSPGPYTIYAVSCPTVTFCVAGDGAGRVLTYNGSTWSSPTLVDTQTTSPNGIKAVSCPTVTFCAAVDYGGFAMTFDGSAWSSPVVILPDYSEIAAVSCASATFCVAGDAPATGSSYTGDVETFDGSSWSTPTSVDTTSGKPDIVSVSCPSAAFCAAGDNDNGNVFIYTNTSTVPGAPTNLVVTAGNASAQLSWSAPASSACAITSYTITPVQNGTPGTPIQTGSAATSYSPTGLTNGATYTFTVAATNCNGTGPAASSARVIPSAPTTPAPYNPLTPYRICDTRAGNSLAGTDAQCTGHTLGVAATLSIQVAGTTPSGSAGGGVPASGATAVVLNVTATNPTAVSYLTVFPTGSATPLASNLNVAPGETVANLVEVALGSSGQVSIYNNRGSTDVVVDVQGYVGAAPSGAGLFNPLPPSRILDTRAGRGALGPAQSLTLQVTGAGGVPTSGVSGVVLNVTATDTTATSYFTVWPAGASRPTASNLNWAANATVPNRVVVPVSSSGAIEIYNNRGYADVIVDVGGWYTTAGGSGSQLTQFSGITPARILDTRAGSGEPYEGQPIGPTGTLTVAVAGVGGVPANATAVVLNVTVTGTTGDSYLTVFPAGTTRPVASDLNWLPGQTVANLTVVKLGTSGELTLYNNRGTVDAIADVVGWYT